MKWYPGGIAYVALNSFRQEEIVDSFAALLPELKKARQLILDLRRNEGGKSDVAETIMSYLTPDSALYPTLWCTRVHSPAYWSWGGRYAPRDTVGNPFRKKAYQVYHREYYEHGEPERIDISATTPPDRSAHRHPDRPPYRLGRRKLPYTGRRAKTHRQNRPTKQRKYRQPHPVCHHRRPGFPDLLQKRPLSRRPAVRRLRRTTRHRNNPHRARPDRRIRPYVANRPPLPGVACRPEALKSYSPTISSISGWRKRIVS